MTHYSSPFNMPSVDNLSYVIGHTPLIRLRKASEITGCNIFGKCEFMNPGGSVKDRAAFQIIYEAEKREEIKKGGLIVEASAGNTGISLAMIARARGYRCLVIIPETQSEEKKRAIRMLGAELMEVPAVPYSNPDNYVRMSERVAREKRASEHCGVLWANQFDNTDNMLAHTKYTAPEIWQQTNHKIDAFICAIGSGGTIAGMSLALKSFNKDIQIALADPYGSAMYSYVKDNVLKSEGNSVSEGIGQGRITENLKIAQIDNAFRVDDSYMMSTIYDLVLHEGLCLGGSSGINVAAAMEFAKTLKKDSNIVTILCDNGNRYGSKLFSDEFLKQKGLPLPPWSS